MNSQLSFEKPHSQEIKDAYSIFKKWLLSQPENIGRDFPDNIEVVYQILTSNGIPVRNCNCRICSLMRDARNRIIY